MMKTYTASSIGTNPRYGLTENEVVAALAKCVAPNTLRTFMVILRRNGSLTVELPFRGRSKFFVTFTLEQTIATSRVKEYTTVSQMNE